MSVENVDARILAAKLRDAGAEGQSKSYSDDFTITRTEGTEPDRPRPRNDGKIESNIAPLYDQRDPQGLVKAAEKWDDYQMPTSEGEEAVKIAGVILRKTALLGFERSFTADSSDYQCVLPDGRIINSIREIVKHVHEAAWAVKVSKDKGEAK